jgi:dTDP-4-dehydrorhamnose reductase
VIVAAAPLELWGGVECSVVRIGDEYRNQLVDTGHAARFADLDAMIGLGIKAARYPILWETVAPESPNELDFSWHDKRLEHLRNRGIKVIASLVHHGSGPRYTNLLDPDFPDLLAEFAGKVARRYPWIDAWNPVNEPMTTARFSCLYGHWYPHLTDIDATFRAVVNQCLAIKRSTAAIRGVIPGAQLIPTEDIGKTFATAPLHYQADHENERRWLTFDLLAGRVVPGHALYGWLRNKAASAQLAELASGDAAPDIIGFDHYLTSERYLDHRLERFPGAAPGSNGRDTYVDVEAVRVAKLAKQLGPRLRLNETWDRYGIPIAVTEVHHGCTRDEQVRWLHQMWTEAEAARAWPPESRALPFPPKIGRGSWRARVYPRV